MNSHDLCVVTTTFYPTNSGEDVVRSQLALQFFKEITTHEYRCCVVDAGSHEDYLAELAKLPVRVYQQRLPGMGMARREVIQHATIDFETRYLLYAEAEKVSFAHSIEQVLQVMDDQQLDLLIPRRSSMISYPLFQQYSEQFMNEYLTRYTGRALDFTFGPRMFKSEQAHFFLDYDGRFGDLWDSIFIPIYDMLSDGGLKVGECSVDFVYPPEQRQFEEKEVVYFHKRFVQMKNVLDSAYEYYASTN